MQRDLLELSAACSEPTGRAVEEIDRMTTRAIATSKSTHSDSRAIRRNSDRVEFAFVAFSDRRAQDARELAGGEVPHPGRLVIRSRDQPMLHAIDPDAT